MTFNKRYDSFRLRLTDSEKKKFENLWNELQLELNISSKRKSEIIIQGFFEYAEKLLKSKDTYTQTNQQLNDKEIKLQRFNTIINFIKTKPKPFEIVFNYFFKLYGSDFGSLRTRLNWLKKLFETNNFVILDLKRHLGDYYVIEKGSYFHAQFREYCFDFPYDKINYQPTSEKKAKKKIYTYLSIKSQYISDCQYMDKAEKFALKAFRAYLDELEKPICDDLLVSEILRLRAEWKHKQALNLLRQEIKSTDDGIKMLEELMEVEK